jgi:hypothetical protein
MRFAILMVEGCAVLGLLGLADCGTAMGQPGQAGERIQYSAPNNVTVASNLNRLDPRQSTFKQVEDDLFKPFEPRASGRFAFPPPQQFAPPISDQRTQEMIERRKNWAFADWNDLFPDASADALSDDSDGGKNKKPVSLIEKYLDNLDKRQQSTTNKLDVGAWISRQMAETNDFNHDQQAFTMEGQFSKLMKQIILPHNSDATDSSVIDFKHANLSQMMPEQIEEQKRRSEEFQRLLDPHWEATQAMATNTALPGQAGNNSLAQFNSTSQSRNLNGPAPGVVDPTARAFYSHVYDDPTALALGLTNNLLTRRPTTPLLPPPTLQAIDTLPKRKF